MFDRMLRSKGVVGPDVASVVAEGFLARFREWIVDRTEEDTVVRVKVRGVVEEKD